jgi:hypothetical protein
MSRAKQTPKRKHRACAVPLLGAAGLSLALASGTSVGTGGPAAAEVGHESLLVKRKSLTLAWRRSMSSTKRMPAHPAYNLPEAAGVEAAPAPELAALTLQ